MSRKRSRAFSCVIKVHGDEGQGTASFPMRLTSIAIDLPVDRDVQRVVDAPHEQVITLERQDLLAKDTFTRPEHFRAMEPRLARWRAARRRRDPEL